MKREHWSSKLVKMEACIEAVDWAKTQPSLAAAWRTCKRGDWMIWFARMCNEKAGSMAHRRVVKAAVACVRQALSFWEATHLDNKWLRADMLRAEQWAKHPSERNMYAANYIVYAAIIANYSTTADARRRLRARFATIVRRVVPCPRFAREAQ